MSYLDQNHPQKPQRKILSCYFSIQLLFPKHLCMYVLCRQKVGVSQRREIMLSSLGVLWSNNHKCISERAYFIQEWIQKRCRIKCSSLKLPFIMLFLEAQHGGVRRNLLRSSSPNPPAIAESPTAARRGSQCLGEFGIHNLSEQPVNTVRVFKKNLLSELILF